MLGYAEPNDIGNLGNISKYTHHLVDGHLALRNAVIDTSRNVWVREEQSGNTAGSRTLRSS